jgi:hypothetical protein
MTGFNNLEWGLVLGGVALASLLIVLWRSAGRFGGYDSIPRDHTMTRLQVADLFDRFVDGSSGAGYEWDDFMYEEFDDPELVAAQERARGLDTEFPATDGRYCNAAGMAVLRDLAANLRRADGSEPTTPGPEGNTPSSLH